MQFYSEKDFKEQSQKIILKNIQDLKVKEIDDLLLLQNLQRFNFEGQETQKECLEFIGKEILIENDEQNAFLIESYIQQMRQKVEIFMKKAQKNYDFTIMLCSQNLEDKNSEKLTEWILNFIFQFEQNVLNLKCQINLQFKNSIQYISSHLKIDSKQLIIMEKQFQTFKDFIQAPDLDIEVFKYYYKKANQEIEQALDYYFVDAQFGKIYKPIQTTSKQTKKPQSLNQTKQQQPKKKIVQNKRKQKPQKKIKKPIQTNQSIFQNIEHIKTINPFENIPQQQNVDQNKQTEKKYKSEYDQFLEQRKASKNKRVTALDIENNKFKFEKFKDIYLKIGTQTKILAIKDVPDFDDHKTRLTSNDELYVVIVPKPSYAGVPKKLLKKQKNLRGSVKVEYRTLYRTFELINLTFLEQEIFDLLEQGTLKVEVSISDYDHSYEKDYTFDIHYFIRINAFKNTDVDMQKILIDKKQSKKYTDKKKAMIDLFSYLELSDNMSNAELNKKGEIFLKQKFYEQTSSKKCQEKFQDFTPKDVNLDLYDFQKYGLYWMIQRESPALEEINEQNCDIHPMWKELCIEFQLQNEEDIDQDQVKNFLISQNQKNFNVDNNLYFYFNILSGDISLNFPFFDIQNTFSGGILADEMGLGKTIMMLGLISFSQQQENKRHVINMRQNYIQQNKKREKLQLQLKQSQIPYKQQQTKFANNLIIMPAILIQQWNQQISKIINTKLKVLVYKDIDKKKAIDLSQFDIVLTSYETVRQDYVQEKYSKNLFQFCWTRIILDEANRIRNSISQNSQSIFKLEGVSKWCVTGTPLENSVQDLYSLIRFLNYEPWADKYWWKEYIQNPLEKDRNVQALNVLIKITKPIILRRSKQFNADILKLQEIQQQEIQIEMNEDEYFQYQEKTIKSKQELEGNNNYRHQPFHIYEIILRLRQLCNHQRLPSISKHEFDVQSTAEGFLQKMLKRQDEREDNNYSNNGVKFSIDYIIEKITEFKEEKTKLCAVCMEDFTEPIITFCQHFFCKFCLLQNLELTSPECPLCKTQLTKKDLYKIQEQIKKLKLWLQKCETIFENEQII